LVVTGDEFILIIGRHALDFLDAGERLPDSALPNHMPGRYVVGNTVHPGSERTSPIEMREAAPQLQMNVLEQITARLRVRLISAREPIERWTEALGHFPVQIILARHT
jgi:hypothetical protein